jgi:hypothetical protein
LRERPENQLVSSFALSTIIVQPGPEAADDPCSFRGSQWSIALLYLRRNGDELPNDCSTISQYLQHVLYVLVGFPSDGWKTSAKD